MKTKSFFVRVLAAMLSLLMLFVIVGCADEDLEEGSNTDTATNDGTGETDETELDPTSTLPTDISYNYETFTFLIRNGSEHLADMAVERLSTESTTIDKAVYGRNMDVQDQYKVEFVFIQTTPQEFAQVVNSAVSVDPETYDVIVGDGRSVFKGVTSAYYADWNELEYVNLDGEWWSQSARKEWATPAGRLFAMNGDLSYQSIGNNCAMFFNKTALEDAHITSPYEQVYNNNWTLEVFMQTAKQIDGNLNGDGTGNIATDSFGYATQEWRGPIYATFCSGVSSLAKHEDGTYSIGLNNEKVGNISEMYIDFVKNSGVANYGKNLTAVRNAFKSGRVIFTDDNVKCALQFKGIGLDFGIVPFPKAEKTDEFASLVGSGTNTFAVVRNMSEEKLSRSSLILEALACYGSRDVIPLYYETILSYQAMQDEHSLEMLHIIKDAGFFDLGHYTNYGQIADVVKLVIDNPAKYGSSIYTAIEVIEPTTMSELEIWYLLDSLYKEQ